MDLENIAIAAVKMSIAQTELMTPYLNDGDKEPVWDGNIYIYSDERKTKENIKKIPVQVKGTLNNNHNHEVIRFPLEISYLRNYQSDGGVIFFVVYIDKTGNKTRIYYASLLPRKIQNILSKTKKSQKKVSFELQKFPENNAAKTTILLNFYDNRIKQVSFAMLPPISLSELQDKVCFENVTLSLTKHKDDKNDVRELIFNGDAYLYAKIKGSDVLYPLEQIPTNVKIIDDVESNVSVNGKQFYSSFHRVKGKNDFQVIIGDSFFLMMNEKDSFYNIRIRPTNNLNKAVIDLPFILEMVKYGQFEISGIKYDFQQVLQNYPKEIIQNNLDYFRWINDLFEVLRLDKNCDLSEMSDEDKINARMLYDALINKVPISCLGGDLAGIQIIPFINKRIALIFRPAEKSGSYYITDFFVDRTYTLSRMMNGEEKSFSRFNLLDADCFLVFENIDYKEIAESLRADKKEPYCFEEANNLLLEMILAYDKSKDTRPDILAQSAIFATIILNEFAYGLDEIIAKINLIQIEKRIRKQLTEEQMGWLTTVAESTNLEDKKRENSIRFGANLLLDNMNSAKYYYEKLDSETRSNFSKMPILRFWQRNMEIKNGKDADGIG